MRTHSFPWRKGERGSAAKAVSMVGAAFSSLKAARVAEEIQIKAQAKQTVPQRLKPPFILRLGGTTKVVPFQDRELS